MYHLSTMCGGQIIQLVNGSEEKAFIYIAFEKYFDKQILHIIKTETEKFMRGISGVSAKLMKKKLQTVLSDLAAHLFSFSRKEDILKEVTKLLKDLYPEITLYLLLAQDMEPVLDLPVKKWNTVGITR